MSCNNLQGSRNTRILMYRNLLRDRFPQSYAIASSVHGFSYLKALKELNLLVDDQRATYRTLAHHNSQRTLQCRHLQLVDVRCPPSPVGAQQGQKSGKPRSDDQNQWPWDRTYINPPPISKWTETYRGYSPLRLGTAEWSFPTVVPHNSFVHSYVRSDSVTTII
jgi:hypothetical protein